MNPNDMRSIMDTINSIDLNEAPLSSRIGRGLTKMKASLGNNKAKGTSENDQLVKKMDDKWNVWLGQTGKKGTLSDLQQFLVSKVGFNQSQAAEIISQFGDGSIIPQQSPSEPESAPETSSTDGTENPSPEEENNNSTEENNGPEVTGNETSDGEPEAPEEQNTSTDNSNSSASDLINSSINVLDTYMTRSHLVNIKPETTNKLMNSIKNIVKSLPRVTGTDRVRGANSALDAIAALEHAEAIPAGIASELQGYIRSAIQNPGDIPPFSPNRYDADAETTDNQENDSTEEPATPQNDETPQPAQRPRVRVPATTVPLQRNESIEYVTEDDDSALSASEAYNIFKAAANYAYSNGIVGGNSTSNRSQNYSSQETQQGNSGISGGNSQQTNNTSSRNSSTGTSGNSPDKKFTKHLGDVAQEAAKLGIDETRYSEIKEVAHKNSFEQIRGDDKATLSAIGYAFMRAM